MPETPPYARLFLLTLLILNLPMLAKAGTVRIATAANFKPTLEALVDDFRAQSDDRITISSASTGILYNQILHGAPFDIFLAADTERPRLLEASGKGIAGTRFTYATGRLVLVHREDLAIGTGDESIDLLARGGISLVIANPVSAPYGQAAQEVLEHLKAPVQKIRLLQASSVLQAYQMWYSGGADAAMVSQSIAQAPFVEIPAAWHTPLDQQAILLSSGGASNSARGFLDFLASPAARQRIREFGYEVPAP